MGVLLGAVLLGACDPFPLSELAALPDAGSPARFTVSDGHLVTLPATPRGQLAVVADGLELASTACTADSRVCVVGEAIR